MTLVNQLEKKRTELVKTSQDLNRRLQILDQNRSNVRDDILRVSGALTLIQGQIEDAGKEEAAEERDLRKDAPEAGD